MNIWHPFKLTHYRRETCLDRSWCRWDSRGKASSQPRRGWDAMRSHPLDPGFLRLRQARTEPHMLWTILIIVVIVALALFIFRSVRSR